MCAWVNPTTWSAGLTVTETHMNQEIRDQLLHIAGSVGFSTGGLSTGTGVQPLSGYFAGAILPHYHIEAGKGTGSTAGTQYNFANAFAAAPVVVLTVGTSAGGDTRYATILALDSTSFTGAISAVTTGSTMYWIAWGSDT